MKRLLMVAAWMLATSACDNDSIDGGGEGSGSGSGEPAPGSLTAFVVDMVANHTVDDASVMELASFETLPDPDGDSNNLDAYRSLF